MLAKKIFPAKMSTMRITTATCILLCTTIYEPLIQVKFQNLMSCVRDFLANRSLKLEIKKDFPMKKEAISFTKFYPLLMNILK